MYWKVESVASKGEESQFVANLIPLQFSFDIVSAARQRELEMLRDAKLS